MVDEMLVAQAKWLPQYKRAISAAKRRMRAGNLIKTKATQGAARLKVKTVDEMRRNAKLARESAAAADKAAADRKRAVRKGNVYQQVSGNAQAAKKARKGARK